MSRAEEKLDGSVIFHLHSPPRIFFFPSCDFFFQVCSFFFFFFFFNPPRLHKPIFRHLLSRASVFMHKPIRSLSLSLSSLCLIISVGRFFNSLLLVCSGANCPHKPDNFHYIPGAIKCSSTASGQPHFHSVAKHDEYAHAPGPAGMST